VQHKALKKLSHTLGCSDSARLDRVILRLQDGANIGCTGPYRDATVSTNAASAYQYGPEVSDAIAAWVDKGFAYGPVDRDKVPHNAKINGIMVRPKPNGSARIILNLSAPKGSSVNEGIDSAEFPATMSSTEAWLKVLHKAGRNCWICKTDWSDAYKHFAVREQDTDLQWFAWGGKFFKELALIFGGSSSAGIFDDGAKLILDFVCRQAKFPKGFICQHLDDVCAAAPHDSDAAHKFDEAFQAVADYAGVKLAPRDDPDKSFAPCKAGTVFGIAYDTAEWTWRLPHEKLARLISDIRQATLGPTIDARSIKSIVGKLIHIKPLINAGKYNFDAIMKLLARCDSEETLDLPLEAKQQLNFWIELLKVCAAGSTIPFPHDTPPAWSVDAYTDAAGGSADNPASGTGGCMGGWWFWIPWPKRIQHGILRHEGKKVSRKLTALELIGPLVVVAANFDRCRYRPVTIWVDNSGSVGVWEKGYSNHCSLSNTLVKAISTIAAAGGCQLYIRKITRCSNTGANVADHLSKGRWKLAKQEAAGAGQDLNLEPAAIPSQLLRWIDHPVCDDLLGNKILVQLAEERPILGYSH